MQRLKLITEQSFDVGLDESKSGEMYVSGIFSTAELENANGRKYKRDTLNREVQRIQEEYFSKNLPFWGELGHPKSPEPNLDRVAIRTTMLEWRGNNLYGKAKVLDTTLGKEAKVLLKEGPIGISSRGLGTVDEETGYVNDSSYRLLAYDLVSNPSNHPSFVNGIYEEKDFIIYDKSFAGETDMEKEVEKVKIDTKAAQEGYYNFLMELFNGIKTKEDKDQTLYEMVSSTKENLMALIRKVETANAGKNVGITNAVREMKAWLARVETAMK